MRLSVSIKTPKAYSKRNAMSGDKEARWFKNADKAGRVSPRTRAASVTLSAKGSKILNLTKAPRCAVFFQSVSSFITHNLCLSAIVFITEIDDLNFMLVDSKGQSQILSDKQASDVALVARQFIGLQSRDTRQFAFVFHVLQKTR